MPESVLGLPLHPLVVHAVVVLLPLAALFVGLAAVLPRFRRWARWMPLAFAAGAFVVTPVAASSGESLQAKVMSEQLTQAQLDVIHQHVTLGNLLVPFSTALFVVAAAMYWIDWRKPSWPAMVGKSLPALAVLAAVGSVVMLGIIGHSGASAVWTQVQSLPPAPGFTDG